MDYLRVGLIVRPHGVNGTLKVQPLTYDVARFDYLTDAYLEKRGEYTPVTVSNVRIGEDSVFLNVSGVEDRDQAEELRNIYLCVDKAHAAKLPEGIYFVEDLIGCKVYGTDGSEYGTLVDVMETGSADVYVVSGAKKIMAPALKKLLTLVDVEARKIIFDSQVLQEVGLFED